MSYQTYHQTTGIVSKNRNRTEPSLEEIAMLKAFELDKDGVLGGGYTWVAVRYTPGDAWAWFLVSSDTSTEYYAVKASEVVNEGLNSNALASEIVTDCFLNELSTLKEALKRQEGAE